jgi:hypothetical protein
VLAVYNTIEYLPYIIVREDYFNTVAFYQWFVENFLPYYNLYPDPNSVIIFDNTNSHCDPIIE